MSDLTYPRPENVRGKFGRWVTADMFHISQRLQEIEQGHRLFIQHLDPPVELEPGKVWNFVIVEVDDNGTEWWVTPVRELDARVIEHVQYLLKVPYSKRFEEAEKLIAKREQDEMDRQLDEALENWGWDFRKQLAHDGFITHTGRSHPTRAIHPTKMEPAWRQTSHALSTSS